MRDAVRGLSLSLPDIAQQLQIGAETACILLATAQNGTENANTGHLIPNAKDGTEPACATTGHLIANPQNNTSAGVRGLLPDSKEGSCHPCILPVGIPRGVLSAKSARSVPGSA
eukprot:3711688-Rhodomonas_salina.3